MGNCRNRSARCTSSKLGVSAANSENKKNSLEKPLERNNYADKKRRCTPRNQNQAMTRATKATTMATTNQNLSSLGVATVVCIASRIPHIAHRKQRGGTPNGNRWDGTTKQPRSRDNRCRRRNSTRKAAAAATVRGRVATS